jgi:hypothetical protein
MTLEGAFTPHPSRVNEDLKKIHAPSCTVGKVN